MGVSSPEMGGQALVHLLLQAAAAAAAAAAADSHSSHNSISAFGGKTHGVTCVVQATSIWRPFVGWFGPLSGWPFVCGMGELISRQSGFQGSLLNFCLGSLIFHTLPHMEKCHRYH
jgi:hypothetical protein